jgi:outer membrane lipoprotein-sorting protein
MIVMSYLRRASTRSLLLVIAGVCVLAVGGTALAIAAGGGGSTPPPEPLDQAIHDALAAQHPDGVSARVTFTNNLFPSGSLLGQAASALVTGASGRLWVTGDGQGRIELQSDAGDAQILWNQNTVSIYDASSNTVYRATLPPSPSQSDTTTTAQTPPALADIDTFLTELGVHWALTDAQPANIAGQPAYSVSGSPKENAGLLGSLQLAWDSTNGTPLQTGIYAKGSASPALGLSVSDISYGSVASSDVSIAPPSGAKVVDLGTGSTPGPDSTPTVSGLDAVTAAAGFPVVAPDSLNGSTRTDVRLIGGDTVLVVYGQGLDGVAVVERAADSSSAGSDPLSNLPTVSLNGVSAHELATELGTILEWNHGGTSFVLAGSMSPSDAEAAARAMQ